MGANTFSNYAKNTNAKNAFDCLVNQALHQFGHNGYSGTIAEKRAYGFVMLTAPGEYLTEAAAHALIELVLDEQSDHVEAKRVADKYGPAGCIALSKTEFVFFGWAAS